MKIQVETTQNVNIEYELASLGDRILAYGIDFSIIAAYELIVWQLLSALDIFNMLTQVVLMGMPFFLYELVCEVLMNGQTFGKRVRDMKVISLTGRQPSISAYLLRWLLRPIDFGIAFGGVSVMTIVLSGKGQRLGDLVANTSVISTKQKVANTTTLFPNIDPDYTPVYMAASKLTDDDIRLIKEVLRDYHESRQSKPLQLLYTKVVEFLEIETEEKPLQFLKSVLKDYHHLTSVGWEK